MSNTQHLVRQLKRILDRFIRAAKLTSDEAEMELDAAAQEVHTLCREGLLEALDQAVGRSKTRKDASISVLAELTDVPEVIERIGKELSHPDWKQRDLLVQTIGLRRLTALAPVLNRVMLEDPCEFCRRSAINAAGLLRVDVNFPVLLQLTEKTDPSMGLAVARALKDYAREEGRPYLRRVFEQPVGERPRQDYSHREISYELLCAEDEWKMWLCMKMIAAWGLAKLGDMDAIQYLGEMLYDPEVRGEGFLDPGQSLRAAQAIADVFDIPFEWDMGYIEPIRRWWEANKNNVLKMIRAKTDLGSPIRPA